MALFLSPRIVLYEKGTPAPLLPLNGLALPYIPSDAFGDGTHPTTRLCAGATDFICQQARPESCLDVGTGTGVLARIARARGVPHCVGTDIDPDSIKAAEMNASLDDHARKIHFGTESPDYWGARFHLVIANILEEPLKLLAPALEKSLAPQGTLLLSGFTSLQIPTLRLTYEQQGLEFIQEAEMEGWVLLRFRKPIP